MKFVNSNFMLTDFKITINHFIFLVLMVSFSSCCRTVDCEVGYLNITTINFSQQESDTFILRRYKANTNFNSLVDTLQLSRNYNASFYDQGPDTSFVHIYESNPFNITSGYDYEVFFPGTNTLRKISDIRETKNQQNVCVTTNYKICYNTINSYNVDGIPSNSFNILIYK